MNTIKPAGGALRIWKAVLFMMALVLFTVGETKTTKAATSIYNKTGSYSEYLECTCVGDGANILSRTYMSSPKSFPYQYAHGRIVFGNAGRTWWGNCDYCTGGFGNGEFFGESATSTKYWLLTKDQVLKFKKGEVQFSFPSSSYHVNLYQDATFFSFKVYASLLVSAGSSNDSRLTSYSFNSYGSTDWRYHDSVSIKSTPTIPNNAVPIFTYNNVDYYGLLSINVSFDFTDGHDYADGRKGGNGRILALYAKDGLVHTHNSKGIEYDKGNDNQHIKYTYCNGHGSDHSQNRSKGTWQNHTWIHANATTDKCSVCGKTRTRHYYDPSRSNDNDDYVNVSVISPTGREDQKSGYFQLSRDGVNWSYETTDQISSYATTFQYGDSLYVRYTRPYYDYYEYDTYTAVLPVTEINDHTWKYTVTSDSTRQSLHINMRYRPFKVNYILSGGSLPNKKDTYIITDTFTIGEPSLSGYTFIGWTMTCNKGKVNGRSFIPCNILVPTKDVTISNMYGDITLTANYEKSGTNDDNGHNKTPDDNGLPDHITDTGDRKTPLVTDSNSKHNMFRVTK